MNLSRSTSTGRSASFGSAMTVNASIHHSEGAASMVRQHDTTAFSRDVDIQRGPSARPNKLRPFATAGAVLVGAGLVMCTPPSMGNMPGLTMFRDIAITAGGDFLAPWIDQFNTASTNVTQLLNNYFLAPGVGMQQFIANQLGYAQQLLDDPTNSNSVATDMQDYLARVLAGLTLQDADQTTTYWVGAHTLDGAAPGAGLGSGHIFLFQQVPSYLPADQVSTLTPIINFLASPASGIIMGELGPYISPWVALYNSLNDGDDVNTTLANMVGAYFNGADLNLDSVIPAIEQSGYLPAGMNVENLDIAFGGLLTPGVVGADQYLSGADTDPIAPVGGSILNSVGIDLTGVPVIDTISATARGIGPIGAMESWGQIIGILLGSGWAGGGFGYGGDPIEVSAPLTGVTLPTIASDFLADGGGGAATATDLSTLIQDVLSWF